jgi:peptide/nickel transport system substrate-binding protein
VTCSNRPRPLAWAAIIVFMVFMTAAHAESIVVGLSMDVNNWNPARTTTSVDGGLIENVYEKLVDFDRQGNPTPALAVSWELIEPDVWRFDLRPDVTFTNGEPFNAAVVKHNLEFQRDDPELNARSWLQAIREVEIIDDLTVHIHTHGIAPELVNQLSWTGKMIPLEYGFTDSGYAPELNNAPVGTGPYKLVEWQKDNRIILEHNEDWWGPTPDVTRVEVRILPEAVTRTAALLSGEVDFIDNPNPSDLPRLRETPGIKVEVLTGQRVAYLYLDSFRDQGGAWPDNSPGLAAGEPNPLQDPRVRRAMYMAIDRDLIAEELHEGLVVPAYQTMLPSGAAFATDVQPPPYDPDAARELLAEAGYPNGFDLEVAALSGRLPRDEETVLVVADQWSQIGIDVSVTAMPITVASPLYREFRYSAGFQSWGALTMPGMSLAGMMGGEPDWGSQNHGRFQSPAIYAVLAELAQEADAERREALFAEIGELFMEEIPLIPLFYATNIRAMKDHLDYTSQGVELIYYKDITVRE